MNSIFLALLLATTGCTALGFALGIVSNRGISSVWALPVAIFVLSPALLLGGYLAFLNRP